MNSLYASEQEFNMSQRAAFCVYSGKGVAELRAFLLDLFDQITEEMNAAECETDYDEDGYDGEEAYREVTPDGDTEAGNEGDDDEDYIPAHRLSISHPHPNLTLYRGNRQSHGHPMTNGGTDPTTSRDRNTRSHTLPILTQQQPTAERSMTIPPVASTSNGNGLVRTNGMTIPQPSPRRTRGGFGHQPVVETSISPEPSEVASNRSTGTNQSNGAGFFRTYQEVTLASSSRSNGALTPDLNFAEIGHGRGAGQNSRTDSAGLSSHGISQVMHSSGSQIDISTSVRPDILADSSNSYRPVTWPHVHRELSTPPPSSSPRTRELHESVQSAFSTPSGGSRDGEGRGRSVKRSLRNTFQVAEHLASSFLFGSRQQIGHSHEGNRPPNGVSHEGHGSGGTSAGVDSRGQSEPARRGRQG
jgi:F-box and leucine-rich repeat protein GRR1